MTLGSRAAGPIGRLDRRGASFGRASPSGEGPRTSPAGRRGCPLPKLCFFRRFSRTDMRLYLEVLIFVFDMHLSEECLSRFYQPRKLRYPECENSPSRSAPSRQHPSRPVESSKKSGAYRRGAGALPRNHRRQLARDHVQHSALLSSTAKSRRQADKSGFDTA